ncbi:uncharacterized protein [Euphorbia lathyris]|uniref:uncharacterized protein n=1 Tax=Euphorbia lathyris TaxID=212925 RepID=UPI00331427FA
MQIISQQYSQEKLEFPTDNEGIQVQRYSRSVISASSPRVRVRSSCTCSNRPGSARCSRHGYVVPGDKLRKYSAKKEIIRRALSPPAKRMSLRWCNFRPTPSRLSNMSMAS